MKRFYWPPLLRGIGTTIILVGTIIAFLTVRPGPEGYSGRLMVRPQPPFLTRAGATTNPPVANKAQATAAGNEEIAQEVFGNPYFEWMGFIGTAVIASSFFVESLVKRS